MDGGLLLWTLLALPVAGSVLCLLLPAPRAVLVAMCAVVLADAGIGAFAAVGVFAAGPLGAGGRWLSLDALSAFHLVVMLAVFSLSSLFALPYFADPAERAVLDRRRARIFGGLWCGTLAAMTLVLVSNNLGIMWVGMEATTLLTAFLICIHLTPTSLEAMWKYLVICSVGVGFAFLGTLFVAASPRGSGVEVGEALLWTRLMAEASALDPTPLRVGFLFLLVGYGTKAGLAPMHSWLPDAHSQAPAPVSALFSGFMLNCALYCVLRYVPLVESALGHSGWSLRLLVVFGLVSILVAAAFIVSQDDAKRLLAYHSVEHLGIIALGVGLGGLGTFAALFHTLNHSLSKSLGFFSAGRLGQIFGTHDMHRMPGALRRSPLWGGGLFASILTLLGVAPFALFMSEMQIVKAAADGGAWVALAVFLAGAGVVFVGALRHAIAVAWDPPPPGEVVAPVRAHLGEVALVVVPLAVLLVLGLWLPAPLSDALAQAASVIGGRP